MDYELLAMERVREALRQAEHERLVRLALAAHRVQPWYASMLASLGGRLTAWGSELQRRFEAPQPTALHPSRDYR